MNFTLHQLEVFQKIAETKSITQTASALHLTQPAISIQLKNFQAQFDIPLTEIIGRQLYLTPFGEEMAAIAAEILEKVHEINYKTLAFKGLLAGAIRISVVSTGKYLIPYLLSKFALKHSGIDLDVNVTNRAQVVDALQQNRADFGLVSLLPKDLALESEPLLTNRLLLVANPRMAELAKDFASPTDIFTRLPLILREEGSGTRQMMEAFLGEQQVSIGKKMVLTSNEAVKQAVIAGMGVSIMPVIGLRHELETGKVQVINHPALPITTMWHLVWPRGKKRIPAAEALLTYIRENKQALVEEHFGYANG